MLKEEDEERDSGEEDGELVGESSSPESSKGEEEATMGKEWDTTLEELPRLRDSREAEWKLGAESEGPLELAVLLDTALTGSDSAITVKNIKR